MGNTDPVAENGARIPAFACFFMLLDAFGGTLDGGPFFGAPRRIWSGFLCKKLHFFAPRRIWRKTGPVSPLSIYICV